MRENCAYDSVWGNGQYLQVNTTKGVVSRLSTRLIYMLNKIKRKIIKRYAEINERIDGTLWEKIKKAEYALFLYEQTYSENTTQKNWLTNYLRKRINNQKVVFFISKTITKFFYLPPDIQICSEDSGNLSEQKDRLIFKELQIPLPISKREEVVLNFEFLDIIFPYLINDITITKPIISLLDGEGPYEIDKNVCLRENDVVIDCGANIGIFSAIAATKGCMVYSFEPFPYVIENYLSKTAKWHKNIHICEYALWDNETVLSFEIDYENIGSSSVVKTSETGQKINVRTIKLDDFVHKNNLTRVDFIKADIEGAERNMLRGAREVLREFSPKLSICTYHLPDDSRVLREIILDANPNYKIVEDFKKMYAYVPTG